ncbi:hypothetical protein OG497_37860 [Streptomyces sp. NBC_01242]|uniref:hypothetical protein n=1 Tax=Streptomyces sp. NBC_01242 TaxID=2903795 RepID=UPI00225BB421|nr:hypothetical protein [Streptomyces sp. NBC_01242]MCX4799625.1 hypothetical protein [Streptomyces sp. NBC_01242]
MGDTYFTTTSYGTWVNHGDSSSESPEATIADVVNGADREWRERMEAAGAFEKIADDYRDAINEALPDRVSLLRSNEFIGPAYEADYTWADGTDDLDIKEVVEGIDLDKIIERHDVDLRIELHEDNAGGLHLRRGDAETVWSLGFAPEPGKFAEDAHAWHEGDWEPNETDGQTPDPVSALEDLEHIATWRPGGDVEIVTGSGGPRAGGGGRAYLGTTS